MGESAGVRCPATRACSIAYWLMVARSPVVIDEVGYYPIQDGDAFADDPSGRVGSRRLAHDDEGPAPARMGRGVRQGNRFGSRCPWQPVGLPRLRRQRWRFAELDPAEGIFRPSAARASGSYGRRHEGDGKPCPACHGRSLNTPFSSRRTCCLRSNTSAWSARGSTPSGECCDSSRRV